MRFLVENWYLIILLFAVVFVSVVAIKNYLNKPTELQLEALKKWLCMAVVLAEKKFGSNTGQLKLMEVYSYAIQNFPWVASFVEFSTFSKWVDDALEWMNDQLKKNKNIEAIIKNKDVK